MSQSDDEAGILQTRDTVFGAYNVGDVDMMIRHFHPDVIQIPAFDKKLAGRAAVEANYRNTVSLFQVTISDEIEDVSVVGDLATMVGTYRISLTPRAGGQAIARSGRYMVVMRRWGDSPTGWAMFRELAQAA